METTFAFLKPDAIEKKLVGRIIARLESEGFRITKMRKGRISAELALLLYPDSDQQLIGMGNKTLKAMADAKMEGRLQELFGSTDPKQIGSTLNSWNRAYATSAEVIAMELEADNAVLRLREIIGKTDPSLADKGTIRGDMSDDSIMRANLEKRGTLNLVHASDTDRVKTETELFDRYFF